MSSEILSVLEDMEKEKGIPRADMISAIVNAIKTAALKGVNSGQELKIEISPKNGQLKAWSLLKVVDSSSDPKTQIHVEKAQVFKAGAGVGDVIEKEIDPSYLGRIAEPGSVRADRAGFSQKRCRTGGQNFPARRRSGN